MRQLLALCLLSVLLSASGAMAGNFAAHPPAEFADGPTLAPINVIVLPRYEVDAVCRAHALDDPTRPHYKSQLMRGCVVFSAEGVGLLPWEDRAKGDTCNIFIPDYVEGEDLIDLMVNTVAHCRGWEIDHPGAVWSAPLTRL